MYKWELTIEHIHAHMIADPKRFWRWHRVCNRIRFIHEPFELIDSLAEVVI